MTLITRPADVFEPGDRVYDTKTNQILIANYHWCSKLAILGVASDDATVIRLADYQNRFLRVIEPGETIPKGAVIRYIETGGLAEPYICQSGFRVAKEEPPSVLVSLPEPVDETTQNEASHTDACKCGHPKTSHIYHEGACRPGFVCEHNCEKFDPAKCDAVNPPDVNPVCNHSVSDDAILQAAATLFAAEYMGAVLMKEPFSSTEIPLSRKWWVEQARELAAEIQKQNKDTK